MYRLNAIEAIYSSTFVSLPTKLPSILDNKYTELSILGDKRSLLHIIVELSRRNIVQIQKKRTKL